MPLPLEPAERLKQLKPSGIRRFFALAQKLPGCVNLSVGEPDFSPPERALKAARDKAKQGKTHYAPTNGIPELRGALSDKAKKDYSLEYDSESEVLVTSGATEAIFIALLGYINPGDEVLILNPGFVVYEPGVSLAGGIPVRIPISEKNEFEPNCDDVTSLITKKSRVMILNYPNNPTGAVLTHDRIRDLAKIAVERDMLVISDEVYEKIVYDSAAHHCLATFPRMRERTLVVGSFSKSYAMTGLRAGYVYGPKELLSPLWLIHQYSTACVNTLAQYAALAALKGPQTFVRDMVKEFDRRRLLVHKRLNEIEGMSCILPKGAFYAFPNIKQFGMSSEDFAEFLSQKARVVTVPGSAFGSLGEGHLRLSYAASYDQLEDALDHIERATKKIERT